MTRCPAVPQDVPLYFATGSTLLVLWGMIVLRSSDDDDDTRKRHCWIQPPPHLLRRTHHHHRRPRIRQQADERLRFPRYDTRRPSVVECDAAYDHDDDATLEEEARRYADSLEYHQSLLYDYVRRWEPPPTTRRNTSSPQPNEITSQYWSAWQTDLAYCLRGDPQNSNTCHATQLRVALGLLEAAASTTTPPDRQTPEHLQQQGLALLRALAEEASDPDAQYQYGLYCYAQEDLATAIRWFQDATVQGHVDATYAWAQWLQQQPASDALYRYLLETAAHRGHAGAAYDLGCHCCCHPATNRTEALEWWVTAAELGHTVAQQRVLGVLREEEILDGTTTNIASSSPPTGVLERRYTLLVPRGDEKDEDRGPTDEEYEDDDDDIDGVVSLERRYTVDHNEDDPGDDDEVACGSIERRFTMGPAHTRADDEASE